jgi:hypothetical protein
MSVSSENLPYPLFLKEGVNPAEEKSSFEKGGHGGFKCFHENCGSRTFRNYSE